MTCIVSGRLTLARLCSCTNWPPRRANVSIAQRIVGEDCKLAEGTGKQVESVENTERGSTAGNGHTVGGKPRSGIRRRLGIRRGIPAIFAEEAASGGCAEGHY